MYWFLLCLYFLAEIRFPGGFAAGNEHSCHCGTLSGGDGFRLGDSVRLRDGKRSRAQVRIVGGQRASDLGWMAYVGIRTVEYARKRKRLGHLGTCGGAIVSERFILSAAHCFVTKKFEIKTPKQVFIIAGM